MGDVAGSSLGDPGGALDVAPGRGVAVRVSAAVVVLGDCWMVPDRQRGDCRGSGAPISLAIIGLFSLLKKVEVWAFRTAEMLVDHDCGACYCCLNKCPAAK